MPLRTDYFVHRANTFAASANIFPMAPRNVRSSVHSEKLAAGIVAHLSGIARSAQEFDLRRGDIDDLALQSSVGLRNKARAFGQTEALSGQSERLTQDAVELAPNHVLAGAQV